jgi:hypothetical protein
MNTHATVDLLLEMGCFLCGPRRDVISRTVWNKFSWGFAVESSSAREAEKRWHYSWADSWQRVQLWDIRRTVTWAQEAEEYVLLEAVSREQLLKTQQAEKRLSRCCGDLESVKIINGAVIVVPSGACKWSVHRVTNPNPVYSHTHIWDNIITNKS